VFYNLQYYKLLYIKVKPKRRQGHAGNIDVVGTLFSLERVRESIKAQGFPPELLPRWFGRLLQSAMAATLAERYLPFRHAVESSLKQVLAIAGRSRPSQLKDANDFKE